MHIPDIRSASSFRGKRVILRADLNVPVENGRVIDTFRLDKALETIQFLSREGARTVMLSHLGRAGDTLLPVAAKLSESFPVQFIPELLGSAAEAAVGALKNGEVLLLENVRRDRREEENDMAFARALAAFGECYVNDAFAVSHRPHATIVLLPRLLQSYAGFLLQKEIAELRSALAPRGTALAIIGGAKFETKGPLIEKFLASYSCVFIGGAVANDLYRAKGYEVGKSLVSTTPYDFSSILANEKLLLPIDVVAAKGGSIRVVPPTAISPEENILDVGPATIAFVEEKIQKSNFVLWNGPMGYYEHGYMRQTEELARVIARSGVYSVVGGGDTIAAISKLNLMDHFAFVSTGGGAMLEFLLQGTLPGIEALLAHVES